MKVFLALLIIATPICALASSPISHVGSPNVTKGKLSSNFRFGYTVDDNRDSNDDRFQMRQHLDYGFTDWYAMRLVTFQDKRKGDNLEHRLVRVESRFHVLKKEEFGWDGGLRVLYNHSDGDKTPHELEFRMYAMKGFGDGWQYRNNIVWEHDIGENADSGLALELRHQLTKKIAVNNDLVPSVRVGAELFNDFGRLKNMSGYHTQDHQFGPVAKIAFHGGVSAEVGYRMPLSRQAPDHIFKLAIGRSF